MHALVLAVWPPPKRQRRPSSLIWRALDPDLAVRHRESEAVVLTGRYDGAINDVASTVVPGAGIIFVVRRAMGRKGGLLKGWLPNGRAA